jgi:D-glycero-D-manno-heptose 1,7-bisphosphate phosphatase
MKRPAIFFDRDNTLIACDGYLGDPDKVVLVEGAAAVVARARQLGYATVVVSNQSGVARGMFDEDAVHAVNARLDELLLAGHAGAVVDRHSFCPYHPEGTVPQYRHDSLLRKPKPGMILEAARTLALDLSRSWVIGDAPRDIEAGAAAGCRTILFHDTKLEKSPAALAEMTVQPEKIVSTLREAIEYIERHPTPDPDHATGEHEPPTPKNGGNGGAEPAGESHRLPIPPRPTGPASMSPAIRLLAQPAVPGTGKGSSQASGATVSTSSSASGPASPSDRGASTSRLEMLAEQILQEIKRQRQQPHDDFSVPKLLAGVVQILALGALVFGYFKSDIRIECLLVAIVLQTLTASLLLMGRR